MRQAVSTSLPRLTAYYDNSTKSYWINDRRGEWIQVNESSLRRHLKKNGLSPICPKDELLSELDYALVDIQEGFTVSYAGPLSGYSAGVLETCGSRVLITSSPRLIEPQAGEFPLITALVENLFQDELCDQRPYVYGWLKVALESLHTGHFRPGQVLAIAGPRECGKSLFQNLVTEILGGRAAKPYRYMSGQTPFNADLFGAEHLQIEDECGSTDLRVRREFGAKIKDFCVNQVQSCHAKNRQALSLRPFWRVTISLNDEPENLCVLPPIDESLIDKLSLLRATKKPMPLNTQTAEGHAAFWQGLLAELPAFVAFLGRWEIPEQLKSQRFGVTHYHHPELLEEIALLAPETRLLSLIDGVFFAPNSPFDGPGVMTAAEVERRLVASELGYEARKLFSYGNACATYLGRLAAKYPERFEAGRTNQTRHWVIRKPSIGAELVTP